MVEEQKDPAATRIGDMPTRKESVLLPRIAAGLALISALSYAVVDETWGEDELTGLVTMSSGAAGIGVLCLINQRTGRWLAAPSVVTGVFVMVKAVKALFAGN